MKAKHLILLLVLLAGTALMAFTPVYYIDDVYYWESDEPISTPATSRDATETQPSGNGSQSNVKITYIEDSITQHSDTVIKAVIHR